MNLNVLKQKCSVADAEDKTLPYTAYLVEYEKDGKTCYDITLCQKAVEMFDHYYDKYKQGLKGWKQSQGRISPKLWNDDMLDPDKKANKPKKSQKRK